MSRRSAPVVPGFVTVGGAGEVLHLAPRSVRDLIYSGRLPSVRLGRLHFVSAADLELERRRRLGLALPRPRTARPKRLRSPGEGPPRPRAHADPAARTRRAEERSQALHEWLGAAAHRSRAAPPNAAGAPELPFRPEAAAAGATCAVCGRNLKVGERAFAEQREGRRVCARCGRRALLAWADQRAREAAAARQLAREPARTRTAPPPVEPESGRLAA
jgi:hypothetical protein